MLKVLVADDDVVVRDMVEQMFQAKGFLTDEAKDGQEAVDLFCSNDDIDAIVLDYHMPHMDGLEAYYIIRGMDKDIPIVIMTGSGVDQFQQVESIDKYFKSLAKPFSYLHLIDVVREMLGMGDTSL